MQKLRLLIICLTIISCESVDPELSQDESIILVDQINGMSWPKDEYQINSVEVTAANIYFNLSYSGGCKEHLFTLVIQKSFEETLPPQTTVILSHDGNNDTCEAHLTVNIEFSLTSLREHYIQTYGKAETIKLKLESYGDLVIPW